MSSSFVRSSRVQCKHAPSLIQIWIFRDFFVLSFAGFPIWGTRVEIVLMLQLHNSVDKVAPIFNGKILRGLTCNLLLYFQTYCSERDRLHVYVVGTQMEEVKKIVGTTSFTYHPSSNFGLAEPDCTR